MTSTTTATEQIAIEMIRRHAVATVGDETAELADRMVSDDSFGLGNQEALGAAVRALDWVDSYLLRGDAHLEARLRAATRSEESYQARSRALRLYMLSERDLLRLIHAVAVFRMDDRTDEGALVSAILSYHAAVVESAHRQAEQS